MSGSGAALLRQISDDLAKVLTLVEQSNANMKKQLDEQKEQILALQNEILISCNDNGTKVAMLQAALNGGAPPAAQKVATKKEKAAGTGDKTFESMNIMAKFKEMYTNEIYSKLALRRKYFEDDAAIQKTIMDMPAWKKANSAGDLDAQYKCEATQIWKLRSKDSTFKAAIEASVGKVLRYLAKNNETTEEHKEEDGKGKKEAKEPETDGDLDDDEMDALIGS